MRPIFSFLIVMLFVVTPVSAQEDSSATEDDTYDQETVLDAATGFFGDGAEGLGKVIEKVFADLGRPNGYIMGDEAAGAFVVGVRYGNGELIHKIEGKRNVHWTGPSIGFDVGGNASKVFTLVYELYDTEDLYRRYPEIEGTFYFVGGVGVNYQQRGRVKLAPIRLGVGLRAGANVGWIKYSKKRRLLPF